MQYIIILLVVASQALGQDDGFDGYTDRDGDFDTGSAEGLADGPSPASILMHHQELGDDGTFKYAFSADNGLQQKEAFHPDGSRTGAYSYVDPHGETVLVRYRADRHGFHVLDGSSIPTTPPLTNQEQSEDDSGPEIPSYQVEDPDGGESFTTAEKSTSSSSTSSPAQFGFEISRGPSKSGLHNRFYRSATREIHSRASVADHSDLDSVAAEDARDLSGAASSYRPFGFNGYVPAQRSGRLTDRTSAFNPLVRQMQYPVVKRGRAEAEVEDTNSDSGPDHAATADSGDYGRHAGKYDDGSYDRHAGQYDDGSYPQHAAKYDDGSYEKYAKMYGEGQYGDVTDVGQSEYELSESVKRPTETIYNDY